MDTRQGELGAAGESKCRRCVQSKCCTYITQALDAPRSKSDFDQLLWQVSHDGVEIYKDGSGWFLLIQGRCEHLQPGGTCGIYAERPRICREYDNDWCELDEPAEQGFSLHFRGYADLLGYCRRRFKRWGR